MENLKENQNEYILQLKGIMKSFSSVKVLKDITLTLKKGEILGLVGENGAGKSTLMNILGGIYQRDSGQILLKGKEFEPTNPKVSGEAGIAFVQQELNLFLNLSVYENLFITEMKKNRLGVIDKNTMKKITQSKMAELGVTDIPADALVGSLPMGKRQMVEITKSIMRNAEIIIFDEPTTSLSNTEKIKLFDIMHKLQAQGKSIIFISHILEDIFAETDEIAVLRDGEIISQTKTSDTNTNIVIKQMVGRELTNIYPKCEKTVGDIAFEAKNICQAGRFDNINISIREGEILGVFGLMGAGRTELLRCMFGLDPMTSGHLIYKGKEITPVTPQNCIANGMAFITENRREEGLLLPKTLRDNVVLANLKELASKMSFINTAEEKKETDQMVEELSIKTFDASRQVAGTLSGGNQQKIVFAKWVLREPKVFFLDEPTRGIDVGAKYEIYSIIQNLAKNKSCILMVSSEMEELMGVCDRIIVLSRNVITGEINKGEFTQELIMKYAVGGTK